jgi:hypothetical protein
VVFLLIAPLKWINAPSRKPHRCCCVCGRSQLSEGTRRVQSNADETRHPVRLPQEGTAIERGSRGDAATWRPARHAGEPAATVRHRMVRRKTWRGKHAALGVNKAKRKRRLGLLRIRGRQIPQIRTTGRGEVHGDLEQDAAARRQVRVRGRLAYTLEPVERGGKTVAAARSRKYHGGFSRRLWPTCTSADRIAAARSERISALKP